MAKAVGEQVDSAFPVMPPGGTMAQAGANVGGAIGAGLSSVGSPKTTSDIDFGRFGWVGMGPTEFFVTSADFMGKPKSEMHLRASYSDVAAALTPGKLSLRCDVQLPEGRLFAFEVKSRGPANKATVQAVERFAERCGATAGVPA
jgi:hypothetical protein